MARVILHFDAEKPRLRTELSSDQLSIKGADIKMGSFVMGVDPVQKTIWEC